MTVYAEILFTDGTRKVQAVSVTQETSHFRIQQSIIRDHPNVEKVSIYEDKWHKGDKRDAPTENHRALAFINTTGGIEVIMHGWQSVDIETILKQKLYWTYVDIPSLPGELEGKAD